MQILPSDLTKYSLTCFIYLTRPSAIRLILPFWSSGFISVNRISTIFIVNISLIRSTDMTLSGHSNPSHPASRYTCDSISSTVLCTIMINYQTSTAPGFDVMYCHRNPFYWLPPTCWSSARKALSARSPKPSPSACMIKYRFHSFGQSCHYDCCRGHQTSIPPGFTEFWPIITICFVAAHNQPSAASVDAVYTITNAISVHPIKYRFHLRMIGLVIAWSITDFTGTWVWQHSGIITIQFIRYISCRSIASNYTVRSITKVIPVCVAVEYWLDSPSITPVAIIVQTIASPQWLLGLTVLLLSSQSVLFETYPAGALCSAYTIGTIAKPSPSASRKILISLLRRWFHYNLLSIHHRSPQPRFLTRTFAIIAIGIIIHISIRCWTSFVPEWMHFHTYLRRHPDNNVLRTPSSTEPLQLLSTPSQISEAPGLIAALYHCNPALRVLYPMEDWTHWCTRD